MTECSALNFIAIPSARDWQEGSTFARIAPRSRGPKLGGVSLWRPAVYFSSEELEYQWLTGTLNPRSMGKRVLRYAA